MRVDDLHLQLRVRSESDAGLYKSPRSTVTCGTQTMPVVTNIAPVTIASKPSVHVIATQTVDLVTPAVDVATQSRPEAHSRGVEAIPVCTDQGCDAVAFDAAVSDTTPPVLVHASVQAVADIHPTVSVSGQTEMVRLADAALQTIGITRADTAAQTAHVSVLTAACQSDSDWDAEREAAVLVCSSRRLASRGCNDVCLCARRCKPRLLVCHVWSPS
jgi:hypothetical protein